MAWLARRLAVCLRVLRTHGVCAGVDVGETHVSPGMAVHVNAASCRGQTACPSPVGHGRPAMWREPGTSCMARACEPWACATAVGCGRKAVRPFIVHSTSQPRCHPPLPLTCLWHASVAYLAGAARPGHSPLTAVARTLTPSVIGAGLQCMGCGQPRPTRAVARILFSSPSPSLRRRLRRRQGRPRLRDGMGGIPPVAGRGQTVHI